VKKPLGKCSHGRLKRRWEDNIKMDHKETGCEGRRRMELLQIIGSGGDVVLKVIEPSASVTVVLIPSSV
jgi:hypothetical protein